MERFESCHSVWLIDREGQRFSRLPRDGRVDASGIGTNWEPYFDFEVHGDGAHVLALNEAGTKLLRFWKHSEPCPHCATDRTEELSVQPVVDDRR